MGMDQVDYVDEMESLSKITYVLVVTGAIILGIEGLSLAAGKELNPLEANSEIIQNTKVAIYLIVGLAGLHQTYFGYTPFLKRVQRFIEKETLPK